MDKQTTPPASNIDDAKQALISAARELIAAGWKRTELWDYVVKSLGPHTTDEEKRRLAIRDINAMIDLTNGMRLKDVRLKYKLPNLYRGGAMLRGRRKIQDILDISSEDYQTMIRAPDGDQRWLQYAQLALAKLDHAQ